MRHFLQPRVLNLAAIAAAVSTLASYPRMSLWQTRPQAVWYLEAAIFLCGIILWGFVFAWHAPYTGRPVFVFKFEPKPFITVTLAGLGIATVYYLWLDPLLRPKLPQEYPIDLKYWFVFLLFSLAFNQLFLTFAPCDWLMRLLKKRWLAVVLTALFGACVLMLNIQALSPDISPGLLAALLAIRIIIGVVAVSIYLRGGAVLTWYWTLLLEGRHLFHLEG